MLSSKKFFFNSNTFVKTLKDNLTNDNLNGTILTSLTVHFDDTML